MPFASLYLGDDADVFSTLSSWWERYDGSTIAPRPGSALAVHANGLVGSAVSDLDAATRQAIARAQRLFIDARSPHAMAALKALAVEHPDFAFPRQTVVLHDQGFPLEVADILHAMAVARLTVPLSVDALGDLATTFADMGQPAWRTLPTLRTLHGRSIQFATRTAALFPVLEQLDRIAPHQVTLLIIGETGTGKTTLAHLIHELSPRVDERFMTVACGALPADLIESELFGHVRGAFTGAERAKVGRFEAAEHGTLLLDEIDVLSPREQTRLLRVIETGEFEPVGSAETRLTHCRLIVASNVDLKGLTEKGQFRSDLYYRLNVLEFHLPPLRDRPLDLVPMAVQFIDEFRGQHHIEVRHVDPEFLDLVRAYPWPGNIRELKNQIRRSVLFARNGRLAASELAVKPPTHVPAVVAPAYEAPSPAATRLSDQVADREREILMDALRAHNFKRTAAARSLGISRVGLYKKMRKYGLLTEGTTGLRSTATALATGSASQFTA
jgi:DNA-binding NtrC family response regulator